MKIPNLNRYGLKVLYETYDTINYLKDNKFYMLKRLGLFKFSLYDNEANLLACGSFKKVLKEILK